MVRWSLSQGLARCRYTLMQDVVRLLLEYHPECTTRVVVLVRMYGLVVYSVCASVFVLSLSVLLSSYRVVTVGIVVTP